jgi:holliday junction DNA helicase RuvB
VRDFAHASGAESIDARFADKALDRLEIDALGLDAMDRRYLTMIADLYGGGPVGVETLAAGLSEPRDTIEDVIEPFLIQLGLIARTARGAASTAAAGPTSASIRPQGASPACSTWRVNPSDPGIPDRCRAMLNLRSLRQPPAPSRRGRL